MTTVETAQRVLTQMSMALAAAAARIDAKFTKAASAVLVCRGKVVTTGIGKAGHLAAKAAATLCSTATPAVYLHPGDAAHGDLGVLAKDDLLIAYSVSGETREVIETVRQARAAFGVRVLVVTARPYSTLGREADLVLDLGDFDEACPLGLVPSTSMVLMLALTDALAFAVMAEKGVTRDDFAARHHGGYLGQKAREQVRVVK